jgi:sulfur carrier protein ThiS
MIRVKVEIMPGLRRAQKENTFDQDLPEGSTVKDLLTKIGFRGDEAEYLRVFVNEKLATLSKVLKEGDSIWVGLIIGGG